MSKEKTGGHWKNRRRAIIGMHDTYKLQMVVEDQIMSKSSKWITDRLPTEEDAFEDWVFAMNRHNEVELQLQASIELGTPWQPIHVPAPYVKPKRWTVKWNPTMLCWFLGEDGIAHAPLPALKAEYFHETAQRIADIYNEVMP